MPAALARIGCWLVAAIACGCAIQPENPAPPIASVPAAASYYVPPVEEEYRLQVGDTLAIRSYFEPQLNQEVVVRPDGRISVLLMGDVRVAGVTPADLAARIREDYRKVVGNTDVTVALVRGAGMSVYLSGEVKNPSLIALDGNTTLLQALARVGGVLPTGNASSVLLIRQRAEGALTVVKVDLDRILRSEDKDPYLERRDVVHVPKTDIAVAGQYVDQYINAIVPRFVQLQLGWFVSRVHNANPVIQVSPP